MKLEFEIPEMFCVDHGVKMKSRHKENVYRQNDGGVRWVIFEYWCPVWSHLFSGFVKMYAPEELQASR